MTAPDREARTLASLDRCIAELRARLADPPDDLDACASCKGAGVVVTHIEAETGLPVDIECRACYGTGYHEGRVPA